MEFYMQKEKKRVAAAKAIGDDMGMEALGRWAEYNRALGFHSTLEDALGTDHPLVEQASKDQEAAHIEFICGRFSGPLAKVLALLEMELTHASEDKIRPTGPETEPVLSIKMLLAAMRGWSEHYNQEGVERAFSVLCNLQGQERQAAE